MWIPSISSSCWRVRRGAGLELGATLLYSYPASLTLLESESWNATLYFHGGDSSLSDSLPALVISTLRVQNYRDLFIHLCMPAIGGVFFSTETLPLDRDTALPPTPQQKTQGRGRVAISKTPTHPCSPSAGSWERHSPKSHTYSQASVSSGLI